VNCGSNTPQTICLATPPSSSICSVWRSGPRSRRNNRTAQVTAMGLTVIENLGLARPGWRRCRVGDTWSSDVDNDGLIDYAVLKPVGAALPDLRFPTRLAIGWTRGACPTIRDAAAARTRASSPPTLASTLLRCWPARHLPSGHRRDGLARPEKSGLHRLHNCAAGAFNTRPPAD